MDLETMKFNCLFQLDQVQDYAFFRTDQPSKHQDMCQVHRIKHLVTCFNWFDIFQVPNTPDEREFLLHAEIIGRSSVDGSHFSETQEKTIIIHNNDNKHHTYVQTDKPIYKAGQTGEHHTNFSFYGNCCWFYLQAILGIRSLEP